MRIAATLTILGGVTLSVLGTRSRGQSDEFEWSVQEADQESEDSAEASRDEDEAIDADPERDDQADIPSSVPAQEATDGMNAEERDQKEDEDLDEVK